MINRISTTLFLPTLTNVPTPEDSWLSPGILISQNFKELAYSGYADPCI
jgi:hypothetical protein